MANIAATMYTFFQNSKLEGSYFLIFAISIFVLYSLNREKNRYFIWYPIIVLVLVLANPLTVWALSKVFPVLQSYEPLTVLVPILVYIPYAIAELITGLKGYKERHIVAIVLFLFIAICGNLFGVFGGDTMTEANSYDDEKMTVVSYAGENANSCVLADESIIPFISAYGENVPLLYGQNLWTPGMDLGIMDEYDDDIINLCYMMREPASNEAQIFAEAYEYACDVVIVKKFEGASITEGAYKIDKQTDNYYIYKLGK